ncbi:MAG: PEP-CTERM sorting domain-containing protein [Okeania sp. SIO2H7]|nr:PEP-CTERM sorting domain-containing protein [Okeania sp. SIO2H7]
MKTLNLKTMIKPTKFSPVAAVATTACLLSLTAPSVNAAGITNGSTLMLFLECNNDGIFQVADDNLVVNGWQYATDAKNDNTDGNLYDIGGMAFMEKDGEVFVGITGGTSLEGEGYDRKADDIFYGDLFFTPAGVNFQQAMETGKLYGIHFTGSQDSAADSGLGVYKNVAAKGVGVQNFGHSSHKNYANIVDPDGEIDNFFGDLGLENDYFDKSKGYNTIAAGTKVENDGFEMLNASDLNNLGFDVNQFGGGSEHTFGFKFDLNALFPPREPQDIGVLEGIAGEAGVPFDENWGEEIAEYDQNITDFQNEADEQQGIATAKQQEADYYQGIQTQAEAERRKIQNQEINPRNKENKNAIKTSPGASGYLEAKAVRDRLNNLDKQVNNAQKVIDNNPRKIAQAERERDTAQRALNAIPSEENYLANKIENADESIKNAYAVVEDLTPQKEAWEQYKEERGYDAPWKWNNATDEVKLSVQQDFSDAGGEWVEIRQDGSVSKQEQELETFSQIVEDFETNALNQRRQAINSDQKTGNRRNSNINRYQQEITNAEGKKEELNGQIADIRNNGKNNLLSELNALKQNAENALNNLDSSTPEGQEREQFYNGEIAELEEQIKYVNNNSLDDTLNYLGNSGNRNGYYKKQLATAIKLDDRPVLDGNGQPEVYILDDFQVGKFTYNNEGERTATTKTETIQPREYYYDNRGRLKSRPVDLVGQPKTVASEYLRRAAESSIYNNVKDDNSEGGLKKISNDAKTAKKNALSEKQAALNAKKVALAEKEKQIKAKNERLLTIEDAIVAEQNQIIMAQRLKETEKAEAQEQALEEQYGVRTENNIIPTTPEEVEVLNRIPQVEDDENRVMTPEPGSIAGLLAVGLALVGGKFRKKS